MEVRRSANGLHFAEFGAGVCNQVLKHAKKNVSLGKSRRFYERRCLTQRWLKINKKNTPKRLQEED